MWDPKVRMQDTTRNVREHHIESIWRPEKLQGAKKDQNKQNKRKRRRGTRWRILSVQEENQNEKTACETLRIKGQSEQSGKVGVKLTKGQSDLTDSDAVRGNSYMQESSDKGDETGADNERKKRCSSEVIATAPEQTAKWRDVTTVAQSEYVLENRGQQIEVKPVVCGKQHLQQCRKDATYFPMLNCCSFMVHGNNHFIFQLWDNLCIYTAFAVSAWIVAGIKWFYSIETGLRTVCALRFVPMYAAPVIIPRWLRRSAKSILCHL